MLFQAIYIHQTKTCQIISKSPILPFLPKEEDKHKQNPSITRKNLQPVRGAISRWSTSVTKTNFSLTPLSTSFTRFTSLMVLNSLISSRLSWGYRKRTCSFYPYQRIGRRKKETLYRTIQDFLILISFLWYRGKENDLFIWPSPTSLSTL